MQCRKRRREKTDKSSNIRKKPIQNDNGVDDNPKDPYLDHLHPTQEECLAVRDKLLDLHGFPEEFARYRRRRNSQHEEEQEEDSVLSDTADSVLDGLVKTVLSQNTTDANSQRAFASLKSAFPTWEKVLAADSKSLENAIRCGGLAPTKASCIKNVLNCLLKRRGELCLEYLRGLSIADIKSELSDFKGIGPKTFLELIYGKGSEHALFSRKSNKNQTSHLVPAVSCVLLFNLHLDDFPVDTHVFQIAKAIGWVPPSADRNKTYHHLNKRIPDELKFDLNCLLFTHDGCDSIKIWPEVEGQTIRVEQEIPHRGFVVKRIRMENSDLYVELYQVEWDSETPHRLSTLFVLFNSKSIPSEAEYLQSVTIINLFLTRHGVELYNPVSRTWRIAHGWH